MKFFCLLPVRDESDIIDQCLDQLVTWADRILVFDTGSIDNTHEIVQEYAAKYKQIKLLKKEHVYFSETRLRSYLFHQCRDEMRDGDWFLRVDSDEFHHITPQQFIKERLGKHETIVYHQYYNFELTEKEANSLATYSAIMQERKVPIIDRRRYYNISVYTEPRLCRYRSSMKWPETVSFPYNAGFVARERIPIRHYRNRDPLQLEHGTKLRAVMLADQENDISWTDKDMHWSISDWKKLLVKEDQPGLHYWVPGTPLTEVKQYNHLAPGYKRFAQQMIHSTLVAKLDKRRDGYPHNGYPQKISDRSIAMHQAVLSKKSSFE